ncbi:TIGR04255 family protein [Deinococcus caeni]|uniref:TIGR04255 family protein n=1 Tax=Deinococcus caeni TaxID=569127 RepID=A0ABP9U8Q0_9DEIO
MNNHDINIHPKLSKPIVYEVEFQLQIEETTNLKDDLLSITTALKDSFPKVQKKHSRAIRVPINKDSGEFEYKDLDFDDDEHFVRFISEDGGKILSLSQKSIVFLYSHGDWRWEDIREYLLNGLSSIQLSTRMVPTSAALIYRNRIDWQEKVHEKYISPWLMPDIHSQSPFGVPIGAGASRAFGDIGEFLAVEVTFPMADENGDEYLHIEFQSFSEIPTDSSTMSDILYKIEYMHDSIYNLFRYSTTEKFMEDHR